MRTARKGDLDPAVMRAMALVVLFWGMGFACFKACDAGGASLCAGVQCVQGVGCGGDCVCMVSAPGEWGTCVSLGDG